MSRIRRAGFFLPVVSLLVILVAACSSSDGSPTSAPSTTVPESPAPTQIIIEPLESMSGQLDLSDLPDDPTELMFAMLDETLDRVARKMAYSGNQTYIPVLLEFLRFQSQPEAIINMTSFLSRLKDNVPPTELMIYDPEQNRGSSGWGTIPTFSRPRGTPVGRANSFPCWTPDWGRSSTTGLRPISGSKRSSGGRVQRRHPRSDRPSCAPRG
jgi:hypothetical protein